ncbi:bifunctional Armadillo-type fold/RPN1 [Babesia duncani]|uniref:Bifunctional Armadillo-type fold/RPN1 n=1 Tax=Babesia duncani TaxID=323732 RepID=A0AAD9PJ90_9APIC|nr:bifunctional Armadillo-type fold/RPN1 [Babesia duncani]
MLSKNKDDLSQADSALKEEIDTLIQSLLATELDDSQAKPLLFQIVLLATTDDGNISSVPKALQFLIDHTTFLENLYWKYINTGGKDSYSLVLLLELISFLVAIDISKKDNADSFSYAAPEHLSSYKMLLYKIEANIIIARLLKSVNVSDDDKKRIESRKINDWGNEYLISLAAQVSTYFNQDDTRNTYAGIVNYDTSESHPIDEDSSVIHKNDILLAIDETLKIVDSMTTYWLQNGFEYDAIDILFEVDRVESLLDKCGDDYDLITRVTTYLLAMSSYTATPAESLRILNTVYELLIRNDRRAEALRIALKLNDQDKITSIFFNCDDANVRTQLALMCESNGLHLNYNQTQLENRATNLTEADLEQLNHLSSGEYRSGFFLTLGAELDVLEPKSPMDIFKSYPSTRTNFGLSSNLAHSSGVSIDSAKENLTYSFVNAFVNCGFGTDKLINVEDSNWVFKHQDYGLLAAVASVGILNLWNVNEGLSQVDKYQYSNDQYVKAGAFAAFGLASCGVVSDSDPISGLLLGQLDSKNSVERLGAILGLGFGYAGSNRETLLELLTPFILDDSQSNTLECSVFASLSLALIFVGTGNQEASEAIIQCILEKETIAASALDCPVSQLYATALALLQMRRMDACEPVLEALGAIQHPFGKFAAVAVEALAYAGSGDIIRVQKLLKCCVSSEINLKGEDDNTHKDNSMDVDVPDHHHHHHKKKHSKVGFIPEESNEDGDVNVGYPESSMAILGIPLICLTEPIGLAMILRLLDHPLQYGSSFERRAVPLALAMANVSNPNPQVIDLLSKLTHDADTDVSLHAIFALGIVGAGTNNSRVGTLMQSIAKSNTRNPVFMFVIRIAVGLLYMGKGTTTISPVHSDGFLLNNVALGGLTVVLMAALNLKHTILDKMPYLLFYVALAIRPRWLITVDTNMDHIQIPVRVGNSIDTTGTAGKPRKISGFQTHTTPVLVGSSERAELANEEYTAFTTILEGIVVVDKTPNINSNA